MTEKLTSILRYKETVLNTSKRMRKDQNRGNGHKKDSEWYILRTEKYSRVLKTEERVIRDITE